MLTKEDIFRFLQDAGIKHDDKVTIHCSLRSIGKIENGADGLIEAFCEYLKDGLFIVPTHTWDKVWRETPYYDVRSTVPDIGTLAEVAAFRKDGAETLMDITSSVDLAEKSLQQLPTGGRTPLAEGIYRAWQMFKARRLKDPDMLPILVLVTDGRANKPLWSGDAVEDALKAAALIKAVGIHSVVIDTEKDFISLHIARQVAEAMGADYYKVSELAAMQLKNIVQGKAGAELLDI